MSAVEYCSVVRWISPILLYSVAKVGWFAGWDFGLVWQHFSLRSRLFVIFHPSKIVLSFFSAQKNYSFKQDEDYLYWKLKLTSKISIKKIKVLSKTETLGKYISSNSEIIKKDYLDVFIDTIESQR